MVDRAEADAVGLVGGVAEQAAALLVIGLVVALEPGHLAVALEGEDVGRHAIEEPAVMADDHGAAAEVRQALLQRAQGGHVEAGDTIHDMLTFVKPKVKVLGTGWVASAGAHIYLGAAKENRFCMPNTRFLLHQPLGGVHGQASDISIEAEEIIKMRERLNRIIARETGQTFEKVVADTERNFWMGAEEAKAYGLVSKIIASASEV